MLSNNAQAPSSHEPKTILVVDDDHILRMTVADCLRDCDYDVCEAKNADEAVALLEDGLGADVVITDVLMAGKLNGVDFALWMETHRPGVPVILASGANGLDQAARRLPAVKGCLAKPFGITELETAVRAVLESAPDIEKLSALVGTSNPSEAAMLLLA
jgi:DNA-binding NtrC family response regulator